MFNRFSLKSRIYFLMSPVLCGLLILAGILMAQNYRKWGNADQLKNSVVYSSRVSALVHQLQKERGLTVGYLNGKASREDLEAQRKAGDKEASGVESSLSSLEADIKSETGAALQGFVVLRGQVDQKASVPEVVKKYGELIQSLIQLQVERARRHPLEGLENRLISQSTFEAAKESMGRLRASLNGVLSAGQPIGNDMMTQLEGFRAGIVANLQSPALDISSSARQQLADTLASAEWKKVLGVLTKVSENAATGNYSEDPKAVFTTITSVIDRVYGLINDETSSILATSEDTYRAARTGFLSYFGLVALFLLGVVILAWRTLGAVSAELNKISKELDAGSNGTAASAREMSSSSATLSSGASEQAAALQETVSALEEVRSMVERNCEGAGHASTSAEKCAQEARKGRDAVSEVVSAIQGIQSSNNDIDRQVQSSNQELTEIVKVISEIAGKTKVINEIVFQTKLLSFNASVEAARAGEHGKGFAVVAEEVGNLAQMSGSAAREITDLLDTGIKRVESIVGETQAKVGSLVDVGKHRVQAGIETAQRCDQVLGVILNGIEEMNSRVAEIANASREQSLGINEISKAMNQLDIVTQQNSSAAIQAAEIAKSLDRQAKSLEASVQSLSQMVEGAHSSGSKGVGASSGDGKVVPISLGRQEKAA